MDKCGGRLKLMEVRRDAVGQAQCDVIVMVCTTCRRLHGSSRADQPLTCPVPRDGAYALRMAGLSMLVDWPLCPPSQLEIC